MQTQKVSIKGPNLLHCKALVAYGNYHLYVTLTALPGPFHVHCVEYLFCITMLNKDLTLQLRRG